MADDLILAVDIGTTAVKAAAYDPAGHEVFRMADDYPTRRAPGGIAEQDPQDWIDRLDAVTGRLAADGLLPRIAGLGLTGHVNSHVFVDAAGRALGPAIIWQDVRAGAEAAELDARVDAADRLRWWGAPLPVDASHVLSRMLWMQRHKPGIWARTHAVLSPKDFILHRMTGRWVSDPMSNIGQVDPDRRYIAALLDLVPGAAPRLVPLAEATEICGTARLGGGKRPVPVAVGMMDAWAGMIGLGMRANRDAVYLSGTSEVMGIVSDQAHPTPGVLTFPRHLGLRLHAGPTQCGGAAVAWFCQTFGLTPERMAAEAGAVRTGRPAPMFLPHLSGERAPLWDAHARGAFVGLGADMGRGHLARAVYEGVGFSARMLLETLDASAGLRPDTLLAGGGGFRSDVWNQIRADILGRSLRRLAVRDPGLLGTAAIASVAAGLHPDLASALQGIVRYDATYHPDTRAAAAMDDLFALYRPLYEALRPFSHRLSAPVASGIPGEAG